MTTRIIFPARRAVEHAVSLPGVVPLRLFPALWPLWQVETTATVRDDQEYGLLDRFLMRAIVDAHIGTVDELIGFLGLPPSMVHRCLHYLATIQHVRVEGAGVLATPLGSESLRAGVRQEWKESRQKILVERYTANPLPRSHYGGGISILTEPTTGPEQVIDGSRFVPLFAGTPFRHEIIAQLEYNPDRDKLNLPKQLRDLRIGPAQDVYLPAYIVETASSGLLVYTAAGPERDAFIEDVCRRDGTVQERVTAESHGDPKVLWSEWLRNQTTDAASLRQLASGVWRATFDSDAFGEGKSKFGLSYLGSFRMYRNHFIQLWCPDEKKRGAALVDRAFAISRLSEIDTVAEFERRIGIIARQLELSPVTASWIRQKAAAAARHDVVARLVAFDDTDS